MDVPKAERSYDYTQSLLEAKDSDSQARYYYQGSLFGFDDYKWLEFD
jgi:hypothetical protein